MGFAVENLCKAALVHSERATTADRSNGKLPSFLKRHDLMDLLRDIGVTVSGSVERRVVERVTRAVLWSGRYPVPVEASDLTKGRRIGLLIAFYCADDLKTFASSGTSRAGTSRRSSGKSDVDASEATSSG